MKQYLKQKQKASDESIDHGNSHSSQNTFQQQIGNAAIQDQINTKKGVRDQQAKELPITSRGGFTASLLEKSGSNKNIGNILALGEQQDSREITRAEASAVVCRVLDWNTSLKRSTSKFTDVNTNQWFFGAAHLITRAGLLEPTGDKTFTPHGTLNSSDANVLLSQAVGTSKPVEDKAERNSGNNVQSLLGDPATVREDEQIRKQNKASVNRKTGDAAHVEQVDKAAKIIKDIVTSEKRSSSEVEKSPSIASMEHSTNNAQQQTTSVDAFGSLSGGVPLSPLQEPSSALNTLKSGKTNYKKIAQGRNEVKQLPINQRAEQYRQLAKAVIYRNQRDNKGNRTVIPDHMCTVTSIAMALNQLGIGTKEGKGKLQFEDALDLQLVKAKGGNARGDRYARESFLEQKYNLKVDTKTISQYMSTPAKAEAFFTEVVLPRMEKGASAVLGMNNYNGKGKYSLNHVVRIQWVNSKGLMIDDPFGKAHKESDNRYHYWSGYINSNQRSTKDGARGEDNLWTWKMLAESKPLYMQIMNTKDSSKKK